MTTQDLLKAFTVLTVVAIVGMLNKASQGK